MGLVHVTCVDCGGPVERETTPPHCEHCGHHFEIRDGIAFFLPQGELQVDERAVETLYNTISHTYDEVFAPHIAEHYLKKRTHLITQLLPQRSTVLDVGCGSGRLAARVAANGHDVFGVDLSHGMLAIARKRGLKEVFGALTTALPFPNDTFDLTMTIATLHHLETPVRVANTIREMGRVIRPGGFVVIWDHNPRNPYWPILMQRCPQDRGDERLVPLEEIAMAIERTTLQPYRVFRSGFVPEFIPSWLLPALCAVEAVAEALPGLRSFAAHNVYIAQKMS